MSDIVPLTPEAVVPAPGAEPRPAQEQRRPWDLHPALTEARLGILARLLAAARRDALARAAWDLGDDPWSIGCRAYSFARNRIARVAERGTHPWLKVLDASHHFVFLVDGLPIRFYRGSADDPTERTLRQHGIEARQLFLALGDGDADGMLFRLAVETDESGRATRVVFLALRGEDAVCTWPILSGAEIEETGAAPPAARQLRLPVGEDTPSLRPVRRRAGPAARRG